MKCVQQDYVGRNSSIVIMNRYGLDGPAIESQWEGGEIFCNRPDQPWGPPSFLYDGYRVCPVGTAAGPLWPKGWRKSKTIHLFPLWAFVALFHGELYLYSRITSTESPSFCMTTFGSSLTNVTDLLPQSHDCSYYVRQILAPQLRLQTLMHTHTTSRAASTCISRGSLTVPAPEAGGLMELLQLYLCAVLSDV